MTEKESKVIVKIGQLAKPVQFNLCNLHVEGTYKEVKAMMDALDIKMPIINEKVKIICDYKEVCPLNKQ